MTDTELIERRRSRARRLMWAATNPGRRQRMIAWASGEATVTRGYLAFRDFITLALVSTIVIAGVTVVRDLRREDCLDTNARRADVAKIATDAVIDLRRFVEAVDVFFDDGLPDSFTRPLYDGFDDRIAAIIAAYAPDPCP